MLLAILSEERKGVGAASCQGVWILLTHSDIRKNPAGFYTTVRRIFFLNGNILVIFLPLT